MEQSTAESSDADLVAAVECPQCQQPVDVSVPDRDVEPTVSAYNRAYGDHTVVHCPAGHKFWVYYC